MRHGAGHAVSQDLSLDEDALRQLVRRQIAAGINFLVPCGTTGESPTLSAAEQRRVVEITIEEARRAKTPVLAGAGGNNTAHVIEMAREFEELGADGILSVSPYYNKPTQEGLYQHYKAIAAAISLPIILYNIPGRTGVNIEPATVATARGDRKYRRREGSVGKYRADGRGARERAEEFRRAFGRRRNHDSADGARRARLDFRGVERNSRGDDAHRAALPRERFRRPRAKFTSAISG